MFDVDRFVADCRDALADPSPELAVKALMERAVAHPADIEAALGTPRQGEVTVMHHAPDLTVLKIIWTPGMAVYPHDHRMWAVIGLYGGREDNTFYRRTPAGLAVAGDRRLDRGDVTLLGKAVIHAVANPLREFTGAIHVYGGDFFNVPRSEWSSPVGEEQPYDVARVRRLFADANARWRAECAAAGPQS
jgi:predicted metal-dependent enzyme (double-stranded beta helix superfamily)